MSDEKQYRFTPKGFPGRPEFSVALFYVDGTHEYARRFVLAAEAIQTAKHYTTNIAAKVGLTQRVIITDGGDCIVLEWEYGKGITYPTEEDLKQQQ